MDRVQNNGKKTKRLRNFFSHGIAEAGCDEAGRGCLAGPVVAAAVILPAGGFRHQLLNDSKQVLREDREKLAIYIRKKAISWGIGVVDNVVIDQINILWASVKAMHLAIDQLTVQPELLLIDGNRFKPYRQIRHECVVDGDAKFKSIAAASILAKVFRDELMQHLDTEYPQYCWDRNKGYGTPIHKSALRYFGVTPYHRMSFAPCAARQLELTF
ncbi:MAG: ribonuclease HII [Bacteroidia bacterium]